MRVVFRADAGPRIGTGHIMRLMTLAKALCDDADTTRCSFVCRHIPNVLETRLISSGFSVIRIGSGEAGRSPPPDTSSGQYGEWLGTTEDADAEQFLEAIVKAGLTPDRIILDHYGLGLSWERAVRAATRAPIWALDDLVRQHESDGIIDTTYGRSHEDYIPHVNAKATILAGAQFALLRPDFAAARASALLRHDQHHNIRNILISMGGMDADNATAKILDAVLSLDRPDLHVHILLGSEAPHLESLIAKASSVSVPATVHAGVDDVAALLSKMDLCVGAPGSSTWERCCLGLPTVNVTIADNQRTIARNLASVGAVRDGGALADYDSDAFVKNHLAPLIENQDARHSLSLICREIADGRGAMKVAREIALELRPATHHDIQLMFDWQVHPITRSQSRTPEPPSWEGHRAWSEKRLSKPYDRFYVIYVANVPSGVIRLEPREQPLSGWEISVLVAPEAHGRGIGTTSIRRILSRHPNDTVHAYVKTTNPASQRAFEKSGFMRVNEENFVREGRQS